MRVFLSLLFIISLFYNSFSQNIFNISSTKNVVNIPFEFINNLIILKAKVNNQELNLVFDTGVKQTVLINMQNNDSLDYKNYSKTVFSGMGNKNKQVIGLKSTSNTVSINNQVINNDATIYIITNVSFAFSENIGVNINGFIGGELIQNHQVKIDYKKKKMWFYPPNSLSTKELSRYRKFPIELIKGKPYLNTNILFSKNTQAQKLKLLIDTGNSDALWVFKTKNIIVPDKQKSISDYMGLGLSGSIEGKRVKTYAFGFDKKYRFKNVYTALPDPTYFSSFIRKRINGMVGNEILRRFFIVFDYANNLVYLKKYRRNYHQGFYYNDSGLHLAYKGKIPIQVKTLITNYKFRENSNMNGIIVSDAAYTYKYKMVNKIIVNYIRKDSPAEKAGLLKGDVLLKINGSNIYRYRLDELDKKFFYKNSKKLYFLIERDGIQLEFRVNNKDPF
jgi:hypothetical protein